MAKEKKTKPIRYFCRGPRFGKDAKEGQNPIARRGCGAELTKKVQAVEQDGKDYKIQCLKCGNVATVSRTPPEKKKEE